MRTHILLGLLLTTSLTALAAPEADYRALGEAHPLVGKWRWTRATNACTEVYEYRVDGTLLVTSGDEKTENNFAIVRNPDANGFYEAQFKIVKDYGGKDCADSETDDTGAGFTAYVIFDPTGGMYFSFGPLRRIGE
jgi:hypothetical protein